MTATMDAEGRITIPAEERLRLGLKPGQLLKVEICPAQADSLAPTEKRSPFHAAIGTRKGVLGGMTTREYLDWVRGPVDLPPSAGE